MGTLHSIANSPRLNLVVAVILLVASGWEIFETFDEPSLGSHHGLFVFALMQILKTVPDLIEGAKILHEELADDEDN
ncbi:MAG: hypothetical protein K0V04_30965 [Deltaproteobacteria bacterium]|nr:hypothetical protein [Deltaproteobacteria bacterium]